MGNLVADIVRSGLQTDVCIINSGTLRADTMFEAGQFTLRDLVSLLPMADDLAVLELCGAHIVEALENGVSLHPKLEGRFPLVSWQCHA